MVSTRHRASLASLSAPPGPGPDACVVGVPSAYGYVSVPSALNPDDGDAALRAWTHDLADFAARSGYVFAGVFADLRGQTETGLYRLLEVLRKGTGVVVVVPDLDHLRHAGCLSGADARTASRYLRARLLLASEPGTGHRATAPSETSEYRDPSPAPHARRVVRRHGAPGKGADRASIALAAVLEAAARQ